LSESLFVTLKEVERITLKEVERWVTLKEVDGRTQRSGSSHSKKWKEINRIKGMERLWSHQKMERLCMERNIMQGAVDIAHGPKSR
jgi:hypothetical protein